LCGAQGHRYLSTVSRGCPSAHAGNLHKRHHAGAQRTYRQRTELRGWFKDRNLSHSKLHQRCCRRPVRRQQRCALLSLRALVTPHNIILPFKDWRPAYLLSSLHAWARIGAQPTSCHLYMPGQLRCCSLRLLASAQSAQHRETCQQ